MRGTLRQTNKAISVPNLIWGAERSLVIMSSFFWGWALFGIFPHWPFIIAPIGFSLTLYVLRFVAKRDPQAVAVFRANSRFILQNRFYVTRGFAGNIEKIRRVVSVPLKLFSRF